MSKDFFSRIGEGEVASYENRRVLMGHLRQGRFFSEGEPY